MQLNDYQASTRDTAIYREALRGQLGRVVYAALGLTGEAGEVANLVKKIIRDDGARDFSAMSMQIRPDRRAAILDEIGDVLWYCSALCDELGADLEVVARANLEKLQRRHG